MYWLSGTLTGYIYVILFTCNAWWCKKYALTARCRGCWVNPKQMISLPCKCLIYCQERCTRRTNWCIWCFNRIELWRRPTSEEMDVYEQQEMILTKTCFLPTLYFYFRGRFPEFASSHTPTPLSFIQDIFTLFTFL